MFLFIVINVGVFFVVINIAHTAHGHNFVVWF